MVLVSLKIDQYLFDNLKYPFSIDSTNCESATSHNRFKTNWSTPSAFHRVGSMIIDASVNDAGSVD